MSAKFVLSRALGVGSILLGVLYLAVPNTLITIIGLDLMPVDPIIFVIRMLAVRNILIGLAMLLSTGKLSEHVWLWLISIGALSDAILTSVLWPGVPVRNVLPLWLLAIFLLFTVGVAYGLDVAAAFSARRSAFQLSADEAKNEEIPDPDNKNLPEKPMESEIILAEQKIPEKS